MKNLRIVAALFGALAFVLVLFASHNGRSTLPAVAATPSPVPGAAAGTNVTNTATATYQDESGNSYTTQSNAVTTTYQNVPQFTFSSPAPQFITGGQNVTDTFVLTNVGNGSGTFNAPAVDATFGGTNASDASFQTHHYTVVYAGNTCQIDSATILTAGGATGNCTGNITAFPGLNNITFAPNATVSISVNYKVAEPLGTAATATSTITADLGNYTITQGALTNASQQVSAAQDVAGSDNLRPDGVIFMQKSGSVNSTAGANFGQISYTINVANGGYFPVKDLGASMTALLGAGATGVFITDKLALPLITTPTVTGTVANGATSATPTYTVYYSSDGVTWSTTNPGSPAYIGILLKGGSCTSAANYNLAATVSAEICPVSGGPVATNGSVTNAQAAYQISFKVQQPVTFTPATNNADNMADSIWGDNGSTEHFYCPGLSTTGGALTADTAGNVGQFSTANQCDQNTTPKAPPGGASNKFNIVFASAFAVFNGPFGAAQATGICPGPDALPAHANTFCTNTSSNSSGDFTAVSYGAGATDAVSTSTTLGVGSSATNTAVAPTWMVPQTAQNTGNSSDTLTVSITLPTAGTVLPNTGGGAPAALTSANVLPASSVVKIYAYSSGCSTSNTLLATSTAGAVTYAFTSVASGATQNYCVQYTAGAAMPYYSVVPIPVTVSGGGSTSDLTWDTLYTGFVQVLKQQQVTRGASSACSSLSGLGALSGTPTTANQSICSGDTIAYTVTFENIVGGTTSTAQSYFYTVTAPTESASPTTGLLGSTAALLLTDDGTVASTSSTTQNNWASFTTGLKSTVTTNNSLGAPLTGTACTYYGGIPATGTTITPAPGTPATKFACTPGGTSFILVPKGYPGVTGPTVVNFPASGGSPYTADYMGTITYSLVAQ